MKRILTTMCALTLLLAASVPALAAEPEQSASYYPTSVEEYMEGDSPRIKKVYQLSLADDPSQIPTEDFERDGRLYYLLDMTRKDEVGVDIQTITQTKTLASETNNMEKILQSLEPQMEVTTEDGYTGTLTLDHTTVKVAADGYATRTKDLSATRTYPNLSEADVSLIPKSIEDNGKSLTLADVQWAETSEAGADGAVTRYRHWNAHLRTDGERFRFSGPGRIHLHLQKPTYELSAPHGARGVYYLLRTIWIPNR